MELDSMESTFKRIAKIYTDFPTKFGLPRQSGMSDALKGTIVFEPEYRRVEAFRGLEGFSHIWLLWEFSEAKRDSWSPTVRPPRLGGNARMGVFATRSPIRPNPIGLSCVTLDAVEQVASLGVVLHVSGIDMMDQTPICDIKPYLPYTDAYPDAEAGWTASADKRLLDVLFPDELLERLPIEKREGALAFLSHAYGGNFPGCISADVVEACLEPVAVEVVGIRGEGNRRCKLVHKMCLV